MAKGKTKVTVKKAQKKPIKPSLGVGNAGGLFHVPIRIHVASKKTNTAKKRK